MKRWRVALLLFLVLLALAAGGGAWWAYQSRDRLIAEAIRTYGPPILGVPLTLAGVTVDPGEGSAVLRGLKVGNPAGFQTPYALTVEELRLQLELASLSRPVVHIRQITVVQAQLSYEHARGGSNLDLIQRHAEAYVAQHAPVPEKTVPDAKPATRLRIDQFDLLGARAEVRTALLQGKHMQVDLPDVHLRAIGPTEDGVSPAQASAVIVSGIRQSVTQAMVPLHAEGVADRVKKGATSALNAVKGWFQ